MEYGKCVKSKDEIAFSTLVLMKCLLTFSVFLPYAIFGQSVTELDTVVKGRVSVKDYRKITYVQAKITVAGTDGTSFETSCDKDGYYYLFSDRIHPNESFVITSGKNDTVKNELRLLNRTAKFTTVGRQVDDPPIVRNFELQVIRGCGSIPTLPFAKNSYQLRLEQIMVLDMLIESLMDNPNLIVEVSGRADFTEDDPELLSLMRAQEIVSYLSKDLVDVNRLVVVAKGTSAPYVCDWDCPCFEVGQELTKEFIRSLSDETEIEEARRLNSVSEFKVLKTDYVPKKE